MCLLYRPATFQHGRLCSLGRESFKSELYVLIFLVMRSSFYQNRWWIWNRVRTRYWDGSQGSICSRFLRLPSSFANGSGSDTSSFRVRFVDRDIWKQMKQ